jgi:hypothetical protein
MSYIDRECRYDTTTLAGIARDSKGVVDALLARFRAAGFAHVEDFAVGSLELDGDSVLAV